MVQQFIRTCAVLFLLIGLWGCSTSPSTAIVQGEVTIDGKGVDEGLISFTPLESGTGTSGSAKIVAGNYRAEEVPLGRVLVRVHAMKETGKTFMEFGVEVPETVSIVPKKHQGGQEITVVAGEATENFYMTSR